MIEIKGVQPRKSLASFRPTAQTPGPNWLTFWREAHQLIAFRCTEAIFEFRRRSRDVGIFLALIELKFGFKIKQKLHISALRIELN